MHSVRDFVEKVFAMLGIIELMWHSNKGLFMQIQIKIKITYYFIALVGISFIAAATHKIVIQVSPPRCLSTASLRMWQARGDFIVMNEPFMAAFCIQEASGKASGWNDADFYREGIPQTFEDAYQFVMSHTEQGPVFVKELSIFLAEYLRNHHELITNPNVHFIFLLRNPHDAISSFYRANKGIIENFSYLVGYQACYEIWRIVDEIGANKPHIFSAEDLCNNSYTTAQAVCNAVDIPFVDHMLHWDNLGEAFAGNEWHELKTYAFTHKWHQPAITSTCFHKPTTYAVDSLGNPTFAEASSEADRIACFSAYQENMVYYRLLMKQK